MYTTNIKNLKIKFICSCIILCYVIICYKINFSCIIYKITGIPCLGCGMTRALLSSLQGNISEAFDYHIMFWSIPLLYWYFIFDGKLFKKKWLNNNILILIIIGFLINWCRNF